MTINPFFHRVLGWLGTLIMAYCIFVIALGLLQRQFMYFPDTAQFDPAEWALKEFELFPVTTDDGLELRSWYVSPAAADKITIVFFQGNAGHLGFRNYKIRPWIDAGYGVLLVGYRGYGNPGEPEEQGLYKDARAAIDALIVRGTPEAGLVFYGESLGTAVAVEMATKYRASALILEAPFTSMVDVGAYHYPMVPVRYMTKDVYDSLSKITDVHMPILLLHGEADEIVPVRLGRKLFAAANEPKQAEFIPEVGHNDIYDFKVQQIILRFIGNLSTSALMEKTP
ncbi:MAG: alpha/beta hydrolase [Alphaproteobacteria bacterium]|nr:alpha/beta hydrolase [Alphaproteobacteria bacterium]